MTKPGFQKRNLFLIAYLVFALLPIYWMVNMSLKTNEEILARFSLWPAPVSWRTRRGQSPNQRTQLRESADCSA